MQAYPAKIAPTPATALVLCSIIFLALISSAWAEIITVTNTNDSGLGSLRDAIRVASSGDAIEFSLPAEATKSGKLDLTWTSEPGLGGNGRSCQVSEVWLIREGAPAKH